MLLSNFSGVSKMPRSPKVHMKDIYTGRPLCGTKKYSNAVLHGRLGAVTCERCAKKYLKFHDSVFV